MVWKPRILARTNSGQASIEYILLFTVSLFIVGGLMFQFNDAFQKFASNYFGAYLACLLESGELPSLGWEARNPADESCNSDYTPFNLASGRQPIEKGLGGDIAAAEARGGSFAGSGVAPSFENQPSSATGAQSEIPMGAVAAPTPRGGGPALFGSANQGTGTGSQLQGNSEGGEAVGSSGFSGEATSSSGGRGGGRSEFVPLVAGELLEDSKKTVVVPANDVASTQDVRRVPAEEGKKKVATVQESEFTLSDFFKYLIIFGIVVAMLIFLGGQALQISKSQEK